MKKRIRTQAWKGSKGERLSLDSVPSYKHPIHGRLAEVVPWNQDYSVFWSFGTWIGKKYSRWWISRSKVPKSKLLSDSFPGFVLFPKHNLILINTPQRWTDQEETTSLDRATTEGPSKHRDTVQRLSMHNLSDGQVLFINHMVQVPPTTRFLELYPLAILLSPLL